MCCSTVPRLSSPFSADVVSQLSACEEEEGNTAGTQSRISPSLPSSGLEAHSSHSLLRWEEEKKRGPAATEWGIERKGGGGEAATARRHLLFLSGGGEKMKGFERGDGRIKGVGEEKGAYRAEGRERSGSG